jgi:AcrR family transcriptional regulator
MRDNKYEKILSVTGVLIREKSYRETSFREIADNVGINKSTIFHYFKNKQEILLRILEKSIDEVNSDLRKITNSNVLEPEEKLRQAFDNHLTSMTGKYFDNVNAYLYELRNLSTQNQKIYLKKRKEYEKYFKKIISEMGKKGYFKGLDTTILTFGILGMLNWVPKWYKKDGPKSAKEVSNIFYRMVTGQ